MQLPYGCCAQTAPANHQLQSVVISSLMVADYPMAYSVRRIHESELKSAITSILKRTRRMSIIFHLSGGKKKWGHT